MVNTVTVIVSVMFSDDVVATWIDQSYTSVHTLLHCHFPIPYVSIQVPEPLARARCWISSKRQMRSWARHNANNSTLTAVSDTLTHASEMTPNSLEYGVQSKAPDLSFYVPLLKLWELMGEYYSNINHGPPKWTPCIHSTALHDVLSRSTEL
jgi:hypothetical protein